MPEPREPGYARGARIELGAAKTPPGPYVRPRRAAAEVRWSDGTWRPCTVVAWRKLDAPKTEMMSGQTVTWVVRLRFADGTDEWFGYRPARLRPSGSDRSADRSAPR